MNGRLIAVVGASGVGKDSLLALARERLADQPRLRFVRRHITRPADAGGETHVAVDRATFDARLAAGDFALYWDSHGLCYGIGRDIDDWLAAGDTVVYNGSRAHLPLARARYPSLAVIAVTARAETIARRLLQRGRESTADIAARLTRQPPLPAGLPLVEVANDGELADAVDAFIAALSRLGGHSFPETSCV